MNPNKNIPMIKLPPLMPIQLQNVQITGYQVNFNLNEF